MKFASTQFSHLQKTLTKLKRQLLSHPHLVRILLAITLFTGIVFIIIKTIPPRIPFTPTTQFVSSFLHPDRYLHQTHNRTNFILLGVGGAAHEAGDLTDTIIFGSMDTQTGDLLLLPIPRDLWVSSLQAKINTAYHYGELKRPGSGGLILAKAAVGEILDQPVHYAALIDFTGFQQLVDLVGGVDVNVPHTFDDYHYPIPGMETAEPESARYEHLHFDAGSTHLDGTTALKFVRSRHSEDPQEGTDIARQARQQLVITALKDKLLQPRFLLNTSNLKNITSLADQYLTTDFPSESYGALARLLLKFKSTRLRTAQLSVSLPETPNDQSLLVNPPISKEFNNQWVLTPRDDDWTAIHTFTSCILYSQTQNDCHQNQ
jgi:LCP family protein required for cell wall assembly